MIQPRRQSKGHALAFSGKAKIAGEVMVFRTIHRFASDRRGNITTMFALSLPVLIFGVGAALDFGRAAQVRTKMDNAAYAAVVAALAPGMAPEGDEDAKAAILNMFKAQISGISGVAPGGTQASATVANPNGNPLIRTATLCYSTSVQTPVVGIVRTATQQIGNCSSATAELPSSVASSVLPAAPVAAPWPAEVGFQVPSGCDVPITSKTAQTWYVDPVKGKPTNKGTSASPWDLATALGQAWDASSSYGSTPKSVHLGDTFLLASGNYGDLMLQGYYSSQIGYDNKTQFLTIKAATGATPVFTSINVLGAGGWIFQGLTVRQIAPNLPAHSYGALVQIEGDNHDIIFDSNTIQSAASVTGWTTQANWLANAAVGISQGRADPNGMKCLSITNNTISNVGDGIQTGRGNYVFIKNNTLNYFIHDGIDYASNNLTIQHNLLTNRIDAGDSATTHPDFMQGQPPDSSTYSNILIDSNIAIRQTDTNLPFAAQMNPTTNTQGIDEFDGNWANITITNNVLVTSATNGIAFSDVTGLTIANNIVLSDGVGDWPELGVFLGKSGGFSTGVTIENNMTAQLVVAATMPSADVTVADNAVFLGGNFEWSGDKSYWDNSPGALPNGNQILDLQEPALFKNLTIVSGAVTGFNLDLMPGTPVVGKGTATKAPTTYITGATRSGSMNLGAYPPSS